MADKCTIPLRVFYEEVQKVIDSELEDVEQATEKSYLSTVRVLRLLDRLELLGKFPLTVSQHVRRNKLYRRVRTALLQRQQERK